jgi:Protein kinase domain
MDAGIAAMLEAYHAPYGWTPGGAAREREQRALEAERALIQRERQALAAAQLEAAAAEREAARAAAEAQAAAQQAARQQAAEAAALIAAAAEAAAAAVRAAEAQERLKLTATSVALGEVVPVSKQYLLRCTGNFCDAAIIGSGSFGTIYMGVDTSLNLRFAVKALNAEALGNAGPAFLAAWRASVQREIATLQAIKHPNIIRLFGYCVPGAAAAADQPSSDDCYLVYELGAARSLDKHLTCEMLASEFDWCKRVRVLVGIACALNYMHCSRAAPIYHRDVKCSNVVLTLDGQPKLIDCGLSVLLDDAAAVQRKGGQTAYTMTGAPVGTPEYMCSHYCRTRRYGDKSEIYSFGLLLLEVLSGIVCTADTHVGLLLEEGELVPDVRAGDWPIAVSAELLRLGAHCTGSYKARPATMLQVVRVLTALARTHCSNSSTSAESGSKQQEGLAAAAEAWYTHQAAAAVQAALQRRACSICFEDAVADQGLDCVGSTDPHFICCDCIGGFVKAATDAAAVKAAQDGGDAPSVGLLCPIPGCKSVPFSTQQLAPRLPPHVFAQYERTMHDIVAQKAQQAVAAVKEAEIDQLRRQLREAGELTEAAVAEHRRFIVDSVLTLRCSNCTAVWLDFDACFAVTCGRCAQQFCAWCCQSCGADAHAHVVRCQYSLEPGTYWASEAKLKHAHHVGRVRALRQYLAHTVKTAALKQRVLGTCAVDFAHLGIQANELL